MNFYERELQRVILASLRNFIPEFGRDFLLLLTLSPKPLYTFIAEQLCKVCG
jgi:hypothetical protein